MAPQVVVLAGGTGGFGRYITEEITKTPDYSVVILTRSQPPPWATHSRVITHQTDYTVDSLVAILNTYRATALLSLVRCPNNDYIPLHTNLLNACLTSDTCKRFIPSEWAGNIDEFPNLPRSYGLTRAPFRETLREASSKNNLQWTIFNFGWFADYFLPMDKTYLAYIPGEFPIDQPTWTYSVKGSGDELQSWTWSRDVARAVVLLLGKEIWEPVTYASSEWGTFNEGAKMVEKHFDRPLKREHRSREQILADVEHQLTVPDEENVSLAELEESTILGAICCPREKTLRQREEYFAGMKFVELKELLAMAEEEGFH
ncbi:NAD(P)-binding protein [Aspergillus saccharolyticus JOP 1030-1]|uniref:NAD(P)-binding protein n=1 Tax=Aspergillus saccharolyticus JOP 1030-1 TaxID=1450539 RepID=A0A318Z7K2_9EURO|nr:NAD(P)-binding protein [Aspergillus saccharolyticus JOP 1030-1]PYH42387.1 NAD(P)-binding protein [Aspergillus saccharolyticus JOP 1030-1]